MTNDFLQCITWILSAAWRFYNGFYLPGTNVTIGSMFLFGAAAFIGIRFIIRILEFNPSADKENDNED